MCVKGKAGLSHTEVLADNGCGLKVPRQALQQHQRVCNDDVEDALKRALEHADLRTLVPSISEAHSFLFWMCMLWQMVSQHSTAYDV